MRPFRRPRRIFYRLKGHDPVPEPDALAWGEWFATADRLVARTTTKDAVVSTVFLGLDHAFRLGPPVLFETMVFGGVMDDHCDRYATWEDAERGHRAVVAWCVSAENAQVE